ncbi:hypothetical protein BX666DRAFT_1979218 [Dichotomocladium elegans]|nr:hypothetical protein BX666DRAFT_1979218 [Dichotomocladium elegans]
MRLMLLFLELYRTRAQSLAFPGSSQKQGCMPDERRIREASESFYYRRMLQSINRETFESLLDEDTLIKSFQVNLRQALRLLYDIIYRSVVLLYTHHMNPGTQRRPTQVRM